MVVAAQHVGDSHIVVVDNNGQHVGRGAVAAQQHEIVKLLVLYGDFALDVVDQRRFAFKRRFQPYNRIDAGWCLGGGAVAPHAVVPHRLAGSLGLFAHGLEFFGRAVAVIGPALGDQLLCHLRVPVKLGRLIDRLLVAEQAKPCKTVKNRLHGFRGGACFVGVLNPDQIFSARVPRIEPVIERGPCATNVEETGW